MGIYDLQPRRLTDDREIKLLPCGKRFGALLARFLAHQPGKPDLAGETWHNVAGFPQGDKHCGHRAFGVRCPAPPYLALAEVGRKRIDGHSGDAHCVGVRRKEQARLSLCLRWKAAYDIGPSRQYLLDARLGAAPLEKVGDKAGTFPFTCAGGTGIAVGVDARNSN